MRAALLGPIEVLTITVSLVPVPAGVTAVRVVGLVTMTLPAATPLIVTKGVPEKPVPVMVTSVPPRVVPLVGEIEVTVGNDAPYVNRFPPVPVPAGVVTD